MTSKTQIATKLRVGDPVMVIAGGNSLKSEQVKGRVGKIRRIDRERGRVWVEGVNLIKRHKRAMSPTESAGIVTKEGSINLSNVMFYAETIKRPVRLCFKTLEDGHKVRGYINPQTKQFEQIEV
ncbi:MAG: 50S ribosomal protein L24 [bacterium]|nr:50S ribosomal protein L24 [bacterium]